MQGIFLCHSLLWTLYFIQGKRTRVLLLSWSRIRSRNLKPQSQHPNKTTPKIRSRLPNNEIREVRILTLNEECQRTSCRNFLAPSQTTWSSRFKDQLSEDKKPSPFSIHPFWGGKPKKEQKDQYTSQHVVKTDQKSFKKILWDPTTSFLTATTLAYAIGAGITAPAGTRPALQLFLVKGFKLCSFQLQAFVQGLYCYFLSLPPCVRIG